MEIPLNQTSGAPWGLGIPCLASWHKTNQRDRYHFETTALSEHLGEKKNWSTSGEPTLDYVKSLILECKSTIKGPSSSSYFSFFWRVKPRFTIFCWTFCGTIDKPGGQALGILGPFHFTWLRFMDHINKKTIRMISCC